MPFFTYILYSEKINKYYIGSSGNNDYRLKEQHNAGRNISTKAGIPWIIQYTESFETRVQAMKRETEIKNKKSRKYIEWLISKGG